MSTFTAIYKQKIITITVGISGSNKGEMCCECKKIKNVKFMFYYYYRCSMTTVYRITTTNLQHDQNHNSEN